MLFFLAPDSPLLQVKVTSCSGVACCRAGVLAAHLMPRVYMVAASWAAGLRGAASTTPTCAAPTGKHGPRRVTMSSSLSYTTRQGQECSIIYIFTSTFLLCYFSYFYFHIFTCLNRRVCVVTTVWRLCAKYYRLLFRKGGEGDKQKLKNMK